MAISTRHLFVKKSGLPGAGKGLFTRKQIRRGERIVEYKGKRVPWRIAKPQDGYNGYLLRLDRSTVIDAKPTWALGRYANDAAGFSRKKGLVNNATYNIYGDRCFIEATRAIAAGGEILVSYGREFWALQRKIAKSKT